MPGGQGCALLALLLVVGCTSPLERGERHYRDGDRLSALETWRKVGSDSPYHEAVQARIRSVENEFEQLVVRYKKRARYYEDKGRLAESVLNYRLALKLQPLDRATLDHVQALVRVLAERRAELQEAYRAHYEAGDLPAARDALAALRVLDPLSPEVATNERQLGEALRAEIDRRLARGRRGFSSGSHRSAEQAFREVLALDPENESAQGYLSYIAKIREEEGSEPGSGQADPREVDATDAEIRAEGFHQNALAAERAGDPFAAIRYDLAALRADAGHRGARSHLAALRKRLEPRVEELVESGRRHYQQEDLQAALDQWRRVLLIRPGHAQTREYVARAERLLENLERLRGDADGASS